MELYGENISFPGTLELSFSKLLDSMEQKVEGLSGPQAEYYRAILSKASDYPELRTGIPKGRVENFKEIIEELMDVIFPYSLSLNEIKCATPPWDFNPFFLSERLNNLIKETGEEFNWEFDGFDEDQLYVAACSAILGIYYHLPMNASRPFFVDFKNKETGRTRHYRMAFNADFMEVRPGPDAKEITKDDYHELIDNYHDIDLWKKKFPEGSWVFSGFNILNMMDLTLDRNIGEIEKDLLNGGPSALLRLKEHMADFLEIEDLELSFVSLEGDTLVQGGNHFMASMMLGHTEKMDSQETFCPYSYEKLMVEDVPFAVADVDVFKKRSTSMIAQNLKAKGLKSYFVCPVVYEGSKLGFLELGSKVKGALNATIYVRLEQVLPVLSVSGHRFHQEKQNRLEAIIQEECTTIHHSVKWRFIDEATKRIQAVANGEQHVFTDLVFKDVYPLYGQLDIRGSSTIRNKAVKDDLQGQLRAMRKILEMAQKHDRLPVYEEMLFVIEDYLQELEVNMNSTSEQVILNFLEQEIEPLFPVLSAKGEKLSSEISNYKDSVDNEFHILYKERRHFDESVNTMNKVLAAFLDDKQIQAQKMFPHYFERYKTDGVEFNMYIGESIAPKKGFNMLLVKNLRLWQLMVMIEMEWEFHDLKKTLKKPLEIASLILAYNSPLAIHFRMDEKRFDVDGAYNARYEIIKKRIDKAHIKGTDERITAPEKMVVIYTSEEVEREYLRYFRFLQSKGYLASSRPEIFEVEELQGVSGLKALRADITYQRTDLKDDLSMEEIMAEIEGNDA